MEGSYRRYPGRVPRVGHSSRSRDDRAGPYGVARSARLHERPAGPSVDRQYGPACLQPWVATWTSPRRPLNAWRRTAGSSARRSKRRRGVHPRWWSLVAADDGRHGRIAFSDATPVGFADVEQRGADATFACFIRAELRGRGLGSALMAELAAAAATLGIGRLIGEARPENSPSLAAMRSAGFVDTGRTEEAICASFVPRADRDRP